MSTLVYLLASAFLLNLFGVTLSQNNNSALSEDLFSKDGPVFMVNPQLFEYIENYTTIFQNAGRKLGMPCSLEHQQRMEEKREARINLLGRFADKLTSDLKPGILTMIQMGLNRSYAEIQKYPKFCQFHPIIKNNESDLHCGLNEKCCGSTSNTSDAKSQCSSMSLFNNANSSDISDLSASVKELPTVVPLVAIHQLPVELPSSTEIPEECASSTTEESLPVTLETTVSTTTTTAGPQHLTMPTSKRTIQHYIKPTPGTVIKSISENETSGNVNGSGPSGSCTFMLVCIIGLFVITI